MRLESALYTAASGLQSHGSAPAVIGDNIANQNTTGYKAARVEFADLFSGAETGAHSTVLQAGSGATTGRVREIQNPGALEATGRSTDFAIEGNGFFAVTDGTDQLYTRAGNFTIDTEGFPVNEAGFRVLGGDAAAPAPINFAAPDVRITPTGAVTINGNLDSEAPITTPPANPASFEEIGDASSFTSTLRVVDSLGAGHDVLVAYYHLGPNSWAAQAYIDGAEVGGTAGTPVQLGQTAAVRFLETGLPDPAGNPVITAAPQYSNGAAAGAFTIDVNFTQFATVSTVANTTQDGLGTGSVEGFVVEQDGTIVATLSSGAEATIGRVLLASFVNDEGLERVGSNTYRATERTGAVTLGAPNVAGAGSVEVGSLETSTVDPAGEFSRLILIQSGYRANSQLMNSVNELVTRTYELI